MRLLYFYYQLLLLSFAISKPYNNKIKKCEYSSLCLDLLNELSIEIHFNIPPKTIDQGELKHQNNQTVIYKSKPVITKQKTVIFKFTPEYIGSYSFQFNHNLKCPKNDMIIVKRTFNLISMPRSLFISEQNKMTEQLFDMYFEFDYPVELTNNNSNSNKKGDIRGFALGETGTGTEMEIKPITNCHIASNDKDSHKVLCSNITEQLTGNTLGFYYYDRCNTKITLGFLSIIALSSSLNLNSKPFPSLLTKLQAHYIKQYQKENIILITFIISTEKRNDIEDLYYIAAPLANKYTDYVFSYAEWEKDTYMTMHFDLKNEGYIKLVIYDFATENLFTHNVQSKEQVEGFIIALSQNQLEWTSQNAFRWLITKVGIKLRREKEQSYYFIFCCFCFVFLVVLRCYLVNKRRPKDSAAEPSFAYNDKKAN